MGTENKSLVPSRTLQYIAINFFFSVPHPIPPSSICIQFPESPYNRTTHPSKQTSFLSFVSEYYLNPLRPSSESEYANALVPFIIRRFATMASLASVSILLFLTSSALAQSICEQGTFRAPSGDCTPCPAGSFQRARNATSCTPCPAGWFGFTRNGIFFGNSCFPCKPGTFSRLPGSAMCRSCPSGTVSGEGFFRCNSCGRGMRTRPDTPLRDMKLTGCNLCPRGTFSNMRRNQMCTKCPMGTTAMRGARFCRKCPPGTYSNRMRICRPCASGTFNDEAGAAFCKLCAPGTFSRGRASQCKPCPAGQFAPLAASRSAECRKCRGRGSTLGIQPAGCKDSMGRCPAGTFLAGDGECKACSPGQRLAMGTMTCVSCAAGEVSDGGVQTMCRKCGPNEEVVRGFGNSDGLRCACKLGFQRADGMPVPPYGVAKRTAACIRCAPRTVGNGMMRLITGSATRDVMRGGWEPSCSGCEEGSFPVMDAEGAVTCRMCPENTVFNRMTETCVLCPAGSRSVITEYRARDDLFLRLDYTPIRSTQCLIMSTGCAVLGFRNERCAARVCPEGMFMDRGRCVSCGPGEFVQMGAVRMCAKCPAGTISLGMAATECTRCPAGQIAAANECRCPRGSVMSDGVCTPCPAGTFNSFSRMFRQDQCYRCPVGTFSGRGAIFCEQCPEGQITDSKGSTSCRPCAPGKMQASDGLGTLLNRCI